MQKLRTRLITTAHLLKWGLSHKPHETMTLLNSFLQLRGSHYFDSAFYSKAYPDVKASGLNPIVHYLAYGASEGRNPSNNFNTSQYVREHPESAQSDLNPLLYYMAKLSTDNNATPLHKPAKSTTSTQPSLSQTLSAEEFANYVKENEITFVDFGCKHGSSMREAMRLFGDKRGLGIDINPQNVAIANENGLDAVVFDILDIPAEKLVNHTTLMHFLEHVPDANVAAQMIRKACEISKSHVYIRQPYFDADFPLLNHGLKCYWSDWTGHPNRMGSLAFCSLLRKLQQEGIIQKWSIHGFTRINDSSAEEIIPIDAGIDQHHYNPSKHPPKDLAIEFDFPVYREIRVLISVGNINSKKVFKGIRFDETFVDSHGDERDGQSRVATSPMAVQNSERKFSDAG